MYINLHIRSSAFYVHHYRQIFQIQRVNQFQSLPSMCKGRRHSAAAQLKSPQAEELLLILYRVGTWSRLKCRTYSSVSLKWGTGVPEKSPESHQCQDFSRSRMRQNGTRMMGGHLFLIVYYMSTTLRALVPICERRGSRSPSIIYVRWCFPFHQLGEPKELISTWQFRGALKRQKMENITEIFRLYSPTLMGNIYYSNLIHNQ